ncbi:MAG: hypothetical protein ACI9DC_005045 [Gammaproteobacteria bacterium]|jgi:hypothetical protein
MLRLASPANDARYRRRNAGKAAPVDPGSEHQGDQPCLIWRHEDAVFVREGDEVQWIEDDVRGATTVRRLEFVTHFCHCFTATAALATSRALRYRGVNVPVSLARLPWLGTRKP